jgi:hypothetical protein
MPPGTEIFGPGARRIPGESAVDENCELCGNSKAASIAKMQRAYHFCRHETISLKVPDILDSRLPEEARRRRLSNPPPRRLCGVCMVFEKPPVS